MLAWNLRPLRLASFSRSAWTPRSNRSKSMKPRFMPPVGFPMLSTIAVAPNESPFFSSPSRQSENHLGNGSHPAAVRLWLRRPPMPESQLLATTPEPLNARRGRLQRSELEDADSPHDQVGRARRADHQRHGPQESAFDIGQRQPLRVHAENARHQRRRQQQCGQDGKDIEVDGWSPPPSGRSSHPAAGGRARAQDGDLRKIGEFVAHLALAVVEPIFRDLASALCSRVFQA